MSEISRSAEKEANRSGRADATKMARKIVMRLLLQPSTKVFFVLTPLRLNLSNMDPRSVAGLECAVTHAYSPESGIRKVLSFRHLTIVKPIGLNSHHAEEVEHLPTARFRPKIDILNQSDIRAGISLERGDMAKRRNMPSQGASQGPPLLLPEGKHQFIEPHRLLLDPGNLRILESAGKTVLETPAKLLGQNSIQSKLHEIINNEPRFDIKGLATSIIHNGFLKHENLIVASYDSSKFIVLEGNRRLAAVRWIFQEHGPDISSLSNEVRQSLKTLPCFLLDGAPIEGSEELLTGYRRAAEIYIGMRHLMGAKSWEPASRYEFQARLLDDEGWTPLQVSERFGRKKTEVLRDLKAQRLYRDFLKWENSKKIPHSVTYNAFAEAARAPAIMNWLEWSNESMDVSNRAHRDGFFGYLVYRLKRSTQSHIDESEEATPEESAEAIVRGLRDMLKLGDPDIEGSLEDGQFESADNLYQERKEGSFAKRLNVYIRGLKTVTSSELSENAQENGKRLDELIKQAQSTLKLLDGFLRGRK